MNAQLELQNVHTNVKTLLAHLSAYVAQVSNNRRMANVLVRLENRKVLFCLFKKFYSKDIDECSENPKICGQGNCFNRHGYYDCQCFPGYSRQKNPSGGIICTGMFKNFISFYFHFLILFYFRFQRRNLLR